MYLALKLTLCTAAKPDTQGPGRWTSGWRDPQGQHLVTRRPGGRTWTWCTGGSTCPSPRSFCERGSWYREAGVRRPGTRLPRRQHIPARASHCPLPTAHCWGRSRSASPSRLLTPTRASSRQSAQVQTAGTATSLPTSEHIPPRPPSGVSGSPLKSMDAELGNLGKFSTVRRTQKPKRSLLANGATKVDKIASVHAPRRATLPCP